MGDGSFTVSQVAGLQLRAPTHIVYITHIPASCRPCPRFPVRRKLLRPCIALTKAVRSEEESGAEVAVDVDTLTFDR